MKAFFPTVQYVWGTVIVRVVFLGLFLGLPDPTALLSDVPDQAEPKAPTRRHMGIMV